MTWNMAKKLVSQMLRAERVTNFQCWMTNCLGVSIFGLPVSRVSSNNGQNCLSVNICSLPVHRVSSNSTPLLLWDPTDSLTMPHVLGAAKKRQKTNKLSNHNAEHFATSKGMNIKSNWWINSEKSTRSVTMHWWLTIRSTHKLDEIHQSTEIIQKCITDVKSWITTN